MSIVKVLMSDTLGGNIIHLCKLYGIYKATGDNFVLFRTTRVPSDWVDVPLREICDTLDFVDYGGYLPELWDDYLKIVTVEGVPATDEQRRAFNERYGFKFCGTRKDLIQEAYPEYKGAYCYLPVNIQPKAGNENAVIIQPWSGKYLETGLHGFTRFFSIEAIERMCSYLVGEGHPVYIIGKSNKWIYEEDAFDKLADKYGVVNLIDKTDSIVEAMSYICGAGYMVGFDGVFTFFAGSQRVSTVNLSPLCPNTRLQFSNDTCESWLDHMISIEGMPAGVPINFPVETFVTIITNLKKGNTGVWAVNKGNM